MKKYALVLTLLITSKLAFGVDVYVSSTTTDNSNSVSNTVPLNSTDGTTTSTMGDATASASISLNPFPALTASISTGNLSYVYGHDGASSTTYYSQSYQASAFSYLGYSFNVTGADSTLVPVIVSGVARLKNTGYSSGSGAELHVNGTDLNFRNSVFSSSPDAFSVTSNSADVSQSNGHLLSDGSIEIDFSFKTLVTSNQDAAISMFASAYSGSFFTTEVGDYSSLGMAYIDPYIYIDPAFENAGLFNLQVEQGIGNSGNSSSVPDTASTVTLLGVSFIGLAALRRRCVK